MNATGFDELLKDALSLPLEERSRMATRLIESIDDDESPLSPAWQAEIARRIQSIQDGTAVLVPHEEVMAGVREQIAQYRADKGA